MTRDTRSHRHRAAVFAACLAALAMSCPEECKKPTPEERTAMLTWLECVDCPPGLLDSVIALAGRKPKAVGVLAADATNGPDGVRVQQVDDALAIGYGQTKKYANFEGQPLAHLDATVIAHQQRYRQRYIGVYRTRALIALGCIHTSAALAALATASAVSVPDTSWSSWIGDSLSTDAKRARICAAFN